MSDLRKFFVITLRGELGPFTVEDLREEVQAGRIARTDRLRTAFGGNAGTVGEALGPATRSNRTPQRLAAVGTPPSGESRTNAGPRTSGSDRMARTREPGERRALTVPAAKTPWLAIGLGAGAATLLAAAWLLHGRPETAPEPAPPAPRPTPAPPPAAAKPASTPPPLATTGSVLNPIQLPQVAPDAAPATPPSAPAPAPVPAPVQAPPATTATPGKGTSTSGASSPYDGTPQGIPGVVLAWKFDLGGEGVAYHDKDRSNQGNCTFRPDERVDISMSATSPVPTICYVTDGEWLAYTCSIATAGRYTWTINGRRDSTRFPDPVVLQWTCDGQPVGTPVPFSGNAGKAVTLPVQGEVPLPAGRHRLELHFTGSVINFSDIIFALAGPPAP